MKTESLSRAYEAYFPIGAAVSLNTLRTHRPVLLRNFGSITAENDMKPECVHPAEYEYDFTRADKIADFAMQNRKLLRGHTLVWHNQTPDWFFKKGDGPAPRELALARMKDHIHTVVGRFRAVTYAWDVVNEAVSDDVDGDILRDSPWRRIVGDDYIAHAFRFAREADPDCALFYNDYNETRPGKAGRIFNLIKDLRAQGAPVDGIGMQGHYNIYGPAADEICAAIELYASLGVKLQITELDMSLFRHEDPTRYEAPPAELMELQAKRYDEIFAIFRRYRRHISGVTLWGIADDVTWLSDFPFKKRKNWPLLFDDRRRPKEALVRVVRGAQADGYKEPFFIKKEKVEQL